MTTKWYPVAIKHEGPSNKHGYAFAPSPSPKRGVVTHSMEGSLIGAIGRLDSQVQPRASWQFSIAKDGKVYQHYEVEANCWHGGDTDDDGGVRANIDLVGIELEGVVGENLTPLQEQELARLFVWLGYGEYTRLRNVYEHKEVSDRPTACPSNRINHDAVAARVDHMLEALDDRSEPLDEPHLVLVKKATNAAVLLTDWVSSRHVTSLEELNLFRLGGSKLVTIPDTLFDSLWATRNK